MYDVRFYKIFRPISCYILKLTVYKQNCLANLASVGSHMRGFTTYKMSNHVESNDANTNREITFCLLDENVIQFYQTRCMYMYLGAGQKYIWGMRCVTIRYTLLTDRNFQK